MLGTVLRQQGDLDGALAAFRTAVEQRPDSPEAQLSLGQLLARRGDAAGSGAALAESERLRARLRDRQASTFALAAGETQLARGDLAGALGKLREALRLDADNARAHYLSGVVLRRQGHVAAAREAFAAAQRIAPWMTPPAPGAR
jgi:Flp pilus assembly protein TadD